MSLFRRFIKEAGIFRTTTTTNKKTGKTSTKTIRTSKPKKAVTTATRRKRK